MYKISKNLIDNVEFLPDIVETPIWGDFEFNCTKNIKLITNLYIAISKRENYFQHYTPTAFGDPEYRYYCGLVAGILQAAELEEVIEDEQIIIKKSNRKILVVDKVTRPQAYYTAKKEIQEVIKECL